MITLFYSTLATPNHPFADATLFVTDDGAYVLSMPVMLDWTSAEVQINNYPPVDITIENEVIEIAGVLYEPVDEIWVNISIAKGPNFGGTYKFPLDTLPLPYQMPRFPGESLIESKHLSFWWRDPSHPPKRFFWE
jgi:hypothetical protein